ncbi:MAG: 2-hydroxyacyl-CoA dehydratase [Blautia sp.]|nr:2-hydroxyacyl-CoA dehydratase [Blautia sp.]
MTTYICKYSPVELLQAFGWEAVMPNEEVGDFAEADAWIHSSVCSHAKQLLSLLACPREDGADQGESPSQACGIGCKGRQCVVLTNCCDSIRRVFDTLRPEMEKRNTAFVMLDLPHNNSESSAEWYARQLMKLLDSFRPLWDRDRFLFLWHRTVQRWMEYKERKNGFAQLAILGARVGDQLKEKLESGFSMPMVDLTCGGCRTLSFFPEDAQTLTEEELLLEYARALLGQLPCTRMEDTGPRDALLSELESQGLKGIIYHTVRFCDYYSFEYTQIVNRLKVPVLKLESDYTIPGRGQLSTRLGAFAESLSDRNTSLTGQEKGRDTGGNMSGCLYYIGIDSGSTTTNAAAVDGQGNILASRTVRTGARAADAAQGCLEEICDRIEEKTGKRPEASQFRVMATGYGRSYLPFANGQKTEISCHALGARSLYARVRTVIDIGGQDSKVICLDENGHVSNFVMNDKCAAGTGRFLEMMAHTLQMDMDQLGSYGHKWNKDLTISSVCTVFAESEVVSLIAENHALDDIIHALNKAVATKTASMVRRAGGEAPFMMTGGVARNKGLVKELERCLGEPLYIDDMPDMAGAIGAALFAKELTEE